MKRLNNKGFTLVEIIAAVTILSIMTVISFAAFARYGDWTRKKAYDNMARSASTAAEQYIMDFPGAVVPNDEATEKESYSKGVSFETLVNKGYLNSVKDPTDQTKSCTGKVVIGYQEADKKNKRSLDKYMYVVYECCQAYKARYVYKVETATIEDKTKPKNDPERFRETLQSKSEVSTKDAICD